MTKEIVGAASHEQHGETRSGQGPVLVRAKWNKKQESIELKFCKNLHPNQSEKHKHETAVVRCCDSVGLYF